MSTIERELVIQATDIGCEIALLENKQLVEFHKDTFTSQLTIGDVYWARVKKILPPMNAVFVDIGEDKEAFLHYTDLGENFLSLLAYCKFLKDTPQLNISNFTPKEKLEKDGKIGDILKINDYIPVQVLKEPISSKGARLSSEISFAGRYVVFMPLDSNVSVSKKIVDRDEKNRLIEIIRGVKNPQGGVIVRTVAEGHSVKDLHEDYLLLEEKWKEICRNIVKSDRVTKVFEEQHKSNTLLRDILNDSFTHIHVNSEKVSKSISEYISVIAPEKSNILKDYNNNTLLFEKFGLTQKIKSAFNKTVVLPSGGYLIIEHTEAMHVIDVNTGTNTFKKSTLEAEETILKVNLEAAREIARLLRLRDLGGIVVIDFIDSKNQEIKDKIYEEMLLAMKYDKASHTVLPLSKFCLMQITRSRTKPQVIVKNHEQCPSCKGSGKISSSILIADTIFNRLIPVTKEHKKIYIEIHPYLFSYLSIGFISKIVKWQWKLKSRIILIKNSSLSINEFYFLDKDKTRLLHS